MTRKKAETRRPELYGVSGRKGHGKDTFARLVNEAAAEPIRRNGGSAGSPFQIKHFAGLLKHIVGRVFGLTEAQVHDPSQKELPLPVPVEMDLFLPGLRQETGLNLLPAQKVARSPRELMQFLGTDYVRAAQADYWIQRLLADVQRTRRVLVPDTRFPNEALALRSVGGLIIKIVRIDAPSNPDEHPSETEIDKIEPDLLVGVRTGDLSLVRKVARFVARGRWEDALRFDYRKVQEASRLVEAGATRKEVQHVFGSDRNINEILDYYDVSGQCCSRCGKRLPPARKTPRCRECNLDAVNRCKAGDPERYRKHRHDSNQRSYWKDPEKHRDEARRQRATLREEFVAAYGGACTCCGETEPAFLTVEHVLRDGKAHRSTVGNAPEAVLRDLKRRGWPKDDYTLLCFNCNMARWRLGVCPHQRKTL